jgi:hypothetical protein
MLIYIKTPLRRKMFPKDDTFSAICFVPWIRSRKKRDFSHDDHFGASYYVIYDTCDDAHSRPISALGNVGTMAGESPLLLALFTCWISPAPFR